MGSGSSKSHTVKVYNYMDTEPAVTLSFDGDDSAHVTAYDHCFGPNKNGGSCNLKCAHDDCDIKYCSDTEFMSDYSCKTYKQVANYGNINEDYLLIFS